VATTGVFVGRGVEVGTGTAVGWHTHSQTFGAISVSVQPLPCWARDSANLLTVPANALWLVMPSSNVALMMGRNNLRMLRLFTVRL
jgi:hypothetical protein